MRPLVAERGEGSIRRYVVASAFLLAAPLACIESQPPVHLGGAVAPVTPSSTVPIVNTTAAPATATPPIEPVVVPVQGGAMPVTTACPNDHTTS